MSSILTPASMTAEQIDQAVWAYQQMLVAHREEVGSEAAVQKALKLDGYLIEQLAVIRKYTEAVSKMIVRKVKVNRSRTPQEVLDATGCMQYIAPDRKAVNSMPRGEGEEVVVIFFYPDYNPRGGQASHEDIERECGLYNLKLADPYSVAAVNEVDREFSLKYPHGTQWKNTGGEWCRLCFDRFHAREHGVTAECYTHWWHRGQWVACLNK